MIAQDALNKYIKAGGVCCPFCGSEEIEGQSIEIDASGASQEVICLSCGEEWVDLYQLVGINHDGDDYFAE